MSETTATPPTNPENKPNEPSKADAAKAKASEAAKAGLKVARGAALSIKNALFTILKLPLLLFKGDFTTRILIAGFLASIVLFGLTSVRLYHFLETVLEKRAPKQTVAGQNMSDFFTSQKALSTAMANLVFLEKFSSSIKSQKGNITSFDLEIFVECDNPDTSSLLKKKLEAVREAVGNALQNQVYEELMTDDGKEVLKQQIATSIHQLLTKWHVKGKIRRVLFTRFVMG